MKLSCTVIICFLTLRVESQIYFKDDENSPHITRTVYRNTFGINYPINKQILVPTESNTAKPSYDIGVEKTKVTDTEYDSYLQAISKNQNGPNQQLASRNDVADNGRIHFEPSLDLSPPPFGADSSPNYEYFSSQQNKAANPLSKQAAFEAASVPTSQWNTKNEQPEQDNTRLNNVTVAMSNFGLNLIKSIIQLEAGNLVISPTSIATALALLQQGATGESQEQISRALQMKPEVSEEIFGTISANMRKRNSRNILSIANNLLVAESFELNPAYKSLAIKSFWSEVTPMSFARPSEAARKVNEWVASKTNDKITDLIDPASLSTSTQLIIVNAVYFKGLWETKFKPERTQMDEFKLSNGAKTRVPFMHTRHSFRTGLDPNTRALVTILPFESHQYSLMLILPKKNDNIVNVLASITADQLLKYQKFDHIEIKVEIPRFTMKTDTNLNPVLKNLGITNIFSSNSDLSGIGLYRNFSPQISTAVHSGYLSVDEQGVTAAASTAFAAVALSYDDSSTTFRADRPFIAVLWDNQFSIPLFIATIEDPS